MIKPEQVEIDSFEQASQEGWFSGSITRDKLLSAILKRNTNKGIRVYYAENHAGLFDHNGFICGISKLYYIPQFTLIDKKTKQVLCRSWKKIINILRRKGYEVREQDLY